MEKGLPPVEKVDDEKVLVWPDLVYTELIAMVVCTFALVVWAVFLKAPLEQPASSARIPNPSKAPWYFLGLQEMLVYYDPWLAGVVFPTMIIVGLIALPYIDFNQKGNGYFTFSQRSFAVTTFLLGFVVLWVTLIVLGTFLRGPNWNFFGLFEPWDPHKNVPLNNVMLSDIFWLEILGEAVQAKGWFMRELPGIVLILAYMLLLPPILAMTVMRNYFIKMGFIRFFVLVTLIQFMAALPIKMLLRWTINLKYIVFIPEAFFNI
jgi:Cytochrome b(C-terminal)/b6/petD